MNKYVIYCDENERIIYEVSNKIGDQVVIKGLNYRKVLQVPSDKLTSVTEDLLKKEENDNLIYNTFLNMPKNRNKKMGTILHFDSDVSYLRKSVELYNKIGIYCFPVLINEKDVSKYIDETDFGYIPDVVVITGHDAFDGRDVKEYNSYKNSEYFANSIKSVKKKFPNIVVVAGACQSNYEALIASGANFASSPGRINVHIYDPAVIAISICTTSYKQSVNFSKLYKCIEKIKGSFGGIETNGVMRMFY